MEKNKKSHICKQMLDMVKDRLVAEIINITSKVDKDKKYIKPNEEIFDSRYRASSEDIIVCIKKDMVYFERFIAAGIMNSEETNYYGADLINLSEHILIDILEILEDKKYTIVKYTIVSRKKIEKEGCLLFDYVDIEDEINTNEL